MGQSKNPAKKTSAKKSTAKRPSQAPETSDIESVGVEVSDIKAFKKAKEGQLLPLPSGLVIRANRVDLQTFIMRGTVPNPLMEIVQDALAKGQKADIPSMMGLDEGKIDLSQVEEMLQVVDSVLVESVVTPKVHYMPEEESDRNDELLYVDEFDPEDKMFIFQWAVGGTADVERFREEARADMATLAEMQGASAAAK
jgi:hypothetical protein